MRWGDIRRLAIGLVIAAVAVVGLLVALLGAPAVSFADTTETPHGGFTPSSKKCPLCHQLHGAKAQGLLPLSPPQAVCYNCHNGSAASDVRDDFGETTESASVVKSRHPVPEGQVQCPDCHTPHKGPAEGNPRSLSAGSSETASGIEFCGVCHGPGSQLDGGDLVTDFKGSGHDLALTPPSGSDIPCASCHEPHGSSNLALIRTQIVDSKGTTHSVQADSSFNPLCLQCHGAPSGTFPGTSVFSMTSHSNVTTSTKAAVVYPATRAQAGDCANCHDPHGKGGRPQYVRADGNQLCYGCHDAAGSAKPADYSYRGSTTYAGSPHAEATGSVSNVLTSKSDGFAAWESKTLPTPSALGSPMPTSTLDALSAADSIYSRTSLADQTGQSDYQMYRFRLPNGASGLQALKASWTGYGSAVAGYPVTLYLWDAQASSWVQYAQAMAAEASTFSTLTPAASRFVDTSGYVWMLGQAKKAVDSQIVATPTVSAAPNGQVTVSWNTLGVSSSWVDFDSAAGPPYASSAGNDSFATTHTVTLTPPVSSGLFHFRVRGTDPSGFTRSSDDTAVGLPAPVLTPVGTIYNLGNHDTSEQVKLTWTMDEPSRAPYTYQVKISGTNGYNYTSSWLTTTTVTVPLGFSSYTSTVTAKDKDGLLTLASLPDNFDVVYQYIPGGSCPFLFSWDGLGYQFESDNFTAGRIGGTVSTGYQQPNPNDVYMISTPLALKNGNLEFKLVEERYEVDYLDSYKLYAVDAPSGTKVYAEKAVAGKRTFPPLQSALHTTRNLHSPVSAVHVGTGESVLPSITAEDGNFAELNQSRETSFTYQTIELDLGADAASAPQTKVVMDAISEFPVTPEGIARRATFGLPQKLEVQNTDGSWRSIAASANPLPTPPEFSRPYIFDLSNAVQGTTGKVRFTFLFRTLIDYIGVDTTQDEWLTIGEVPSLAANLSYHGVDQETGAADFKEFQYGVGLSTGAYYAGNYTRFGDVSALLGGIDDKFVIMGQGDELTLVYQPLADPVSGTSRQYVFSAYGYYKDRKTDLPAEVDPLPFQAMSNYPYPSTESYPTDADHQAYLAEYNTRVEAGEQPVATQTMAAKSNEVAHRSINTDTVRLELSYGGTIAGSCDGCHTVHGATDTSGTLLPKLTVAAEYNSCLGSGLGCHSLASSSEGGINITGSLTATSNPTGHHDLLPAQMSASGSKMKCSDCHNPHADDPESPFKDPDSIGTSMPQSVDDYIDANGAYYTMVAAQHDAVPPVTSGFYIDVASHPATSPAFVWQTDEPASSWVDLGLTGSYELGSIGTPELTTQHSVVTTGLAMGTTYHFRIRTADAVGNVSVSADATFSPAAAPLTPVLDPAPSGYEWTDYTLTWGAVTAPDADAVEYQAELTNGTTTYNFGWSTANSWPVTALAYGDWKWRVRSRDAAHTYAASTWSGYSSFSNYTPSYTCPYLFTWDGTKYGFETDLYGQGKLAIPRATGYLKPEPHEAYVLQNDPAVKDGYLDFKMVEERPEVDYMDEWSLYSADVPDGLDLYTERPAQGGQPFTTVAAEVHTAKKDAPGPTTATWVNNGQDVLDLISRSDQRRLTLNNDRNTDFTYQTIELDLSDTLGAPQTKLLLDAQTMFPNSPAGYARAKTFTYTSRMEVQDANGAWVSVPASACPLPRPAEFYRPIAMDISNIWKSSSRKLRLTFLFKTYIDSIRVDTTQDVAVNLTKLPLHSAALGHHGQDPVSGPGDFYTYLYGEPNAWTSFFPGNYTKFGDVTELLATGNDDKYVVYGGGDEIAAQFEQPAAPAAGTQRRYLAFVDGWYKDPNSDCPKTVEPLPFHSMSNYPYPSTEQYPADAEHQQYLSDWNTRYEATTQPVSQPAPSQPVQQRTFLQKLENLFSFLLPADAQATMPVADARSDYTLTFMAGAQEPGTGRFSVDTDAAILRRTVADGSVTGHTAAAAWESAGATPTPSSPGSAAGSSALSNAATVDQTYWRTDLAAADHATNYQVFKFSLTTAQIDGARELTFSWTGHGETHPGYPTSVWIWNRRTATWDTVLAPTDLGIDRTISRQDSQTGSTFCLRCHDGAPPAGVVVPASVTNIGAEWTGAAGGNFHSGVASNGWGGSLKPPYSRGQSVSCSACHTSHGGTNIYHVPTTVNGTSGIVATNGNNVQKLCAACHAGTVEDYHQGCYDCHYGYNDTTGYGHNMRGQGPKATDDCLSCHGHGKTWQHAPFDAGCASEGCHGEPSTPGWNAVYPTL